MGPWLELISALGSAVGLVTIGSIQRQIFTPHENKFHHLKSELLLRFALECLSLCF